MLCEVFGQILNHSSDHKRHVGFGRPWINHSEPSEIIVLARGRREIIVFARERRDEFSTGPKEISNDS